MKNRRADLRTGSVIRYPYLWARQSSKGETEGRKDRPAAVAVRLPRPDGDVLVLLAITSKAPLPDQRAVEIPEAEKKRAGLSAGMRLWIVIDEANVDVIGRSFYLLPDPALGSFSDGFFVPVVRRMIRERPFRSVDRTS
ncbi:hypothetical protein [Mesorhizobium australicum]|uniref:PemK-like, MazF-like toxin of type II toxin-antitoxin system n=1 Tax=Mesorhizobium australicum TaxID=536018 RepID=A0A1X7NT50_9HYPH|nr:hypothetical protein [Mesorhizobium australicum]SMH41273.1 hypothetical protein SAMN02982922_2516 [Mesorhizobium australicum]